MAMGVVGLGGWDLGVGLSSRDCSSSVRVSFGFLETPSVPSLFSRSGSISLFSLCDGVRMILYYKRDDNVPLFPQHLSLLPDVHV